MPTTMPALDTLLTVRGAAAHLGVTERRMYRLAEAGRIRHLKVGGQLRFDPADLDAFVQSCVREVVR